LARVQGRPSSPVDFADDFDLLVRPRYQNYAIGLKALSLAATEQPLGISVSVDELTPQTESRRPTLTIP
jgi:hypothetical protein